MLRQVGLLAPGLGVLLSFCWPAPASHAFVLSCKQRRQAFIENTKRAHHETETGDDEQKRSQRGLPRVQLWESC